ncbi:Transport-associated domain protein [Rhodopirellula maiorica SM1]|uniref:Transport-associated domain protein n=2 Tax=Novipirellula TaxID=2795426 RepID=M5RF75_9BACT|nr:Transport-associated domain protein [Rhodopirellula maiorica SM1]
MVFASEPNTLAPAATRFQMPPLPLPTIQQTGHYQPTGHYPAAQSNTAARPNVRANPFFDSKEVSPSDSAIQLASGDDQPAIRLKPIGAAIGLQPIGSPRIVRPSGSAMTIEKPPATAVRTNPLIGSSHHENEDLVEAVVIPPVDVPTSSDPVVSSAPVTAAAVTPAPVSAAPATTAQPSMVISMVTPPTIDAENAFEQNKSAESDDATLQPIEFAAVPHGEPEATAEHADVELVSDSEPVFFSFSDDSEGLSAPSNVPSQTDHDPITADTVAPQSVAAEPMASEPAVSGPAVSGPAVSGPAMSETAANETANSIASEHTDSENHDAVESGVEASESNHHDASDEEIALELPAPVSIVDPAEERFPAATLQPLSDVATSPAELMELSERAAMRPHGPSINVAPEINQQARKPAKRYRPPVAVESPPLGYERIAEQSSPGTVQPVSPLMLKGSRNTTSGHEFAGNVSQPAGSPIPLYMTQAQVRSLTIGGELRRVSIEDQNVCRAIASGHNELKLIGAGRGVTRLVVWADGTPDAPSKVQHFDVHVQDAVEATGDTIGDKAELLNRTIRKSFPDSRVLVKTEGDHLVISGSCTSEETATKILRMVRKTCLIPVHDELKVR